MPRGVWTENSCSTSIVGVWRIIGNLRRFTRQEAGYTDYDAVRPTIDVLYSDISI